MPQPPTNDDNALSRSDARKARKIATGPLMASVAEPVTQSPAKAQAKAAPLGNFQQVRALIDQALQADTPSNEA